MRKLMPSSRGRSVGSNAVKVGFGVTASLIAQLVKNPPAMIWFPGWEDPPKGKATHSSILAWRILQSWTQLSRLFESLCGSNPWIYCANYLLAPYWPSFRLAVIHFISKIWMTLLSFFSLYPTCLKGLNYLYLTIFCQIWMSWSFKSVLSFT